MSQLCIAIHLSPQIDPANCFADYLFGNEYDRERRQDIIMFGQRNKFINSTVFVIINSNKTLSAKYVISVLVIWQ